MPEENFDYESEAVDQGVQDLTRERRTSMMVLDLI